MSGDVWVQESMAEIYRTLKALYPEHIAFIQNGYFWEVYEDDASQCSRLFGWQIAKRGDLDFTGVPVNAYRFREELVRRGQPHLFVRQRTFGENVDSIEREVSEVWP